MHEPANTIESPPQRIAVIGGGLSGLAAAHRLVEIAGKAGHPLELKLFEASDRLGGVIATRQIGDYLVEMGADSFITNKPWAVSLCKRLGLEDRLIPTDETYRRSLVLRNGKPLPVPEGFMLLSPAKILPVLRSPIFSWRGKLRMGWEYFLPRGKQTEDESLADFVRRRFGREALDRLVQPLVGGIYTSDPEKLSLKATMPRFLEMEQQYRSLIRASRKQAGRQSATEQLSSGARYGLFTTLVGGIGELFEALARRLEGSAEIVTNCRVMSVNRGNGPSSRFRLLLESGQHEDFDAVVLAVPAYRAAELIVGYDARLAEQLNQIEYASSAIVVSGHNLADFDHPLDAFGLVVPAVEKRRILAVSFSSRKFPGRAPEGRVLLRTFVGGAMQPELLTNSDDELIAIVRSELCDLLGMQQPEEFAEVARYNRAMPQYHVGHAEKVAAISRQLTCHPGLTLAGNAFHGVGLPDCIYSGERAAERLLAPKNRQ